MPFDANNNYVGNYYANNDRLGHTTPDCDASEPLQPYLPKSYPAPWLPAKRRDEAHPVAANVVVSSHNIVGVDKSGYLVPAGYFSGNTGPGGDYCIVKYGANDVGYTVNAKTGLIVSSASEYVVLAAPDNSASLAGVTGTISSGSNSLTASNATNIAVGAYIAIATVTGVFRVIAKNGNVLTLDANVGSAATTQAVTFALPTIAGVTVQSSDVTFAQSCDLIPGNVARGLGYALRNMWQNIHGTVVKSTTNGILYEVASMDPTKNIKHNYAHEMGNAIRTEFIIRVPWIGATPDTLVQKAADLGITGYNLTDYAKSFSHMVGVKGNGKGQLFAGCRVVPSTLQGDAGNYMPYNPAKHDPDQIIGIVHGFEYLHPVKDYADRVRTQFERHLDFRGPFTTQNPVTGLMGGSATRGNTYQVSLGTNAFYRFAIDQAKVPPEECYTTVLIRILL